MPVEFSKMFVAWREKHQHEKGANVPRFPFLVVWSEKCVSWVIFWRAWGSQKRGFDCIFTVFYCFQLKSTFFDIKHAKCDLTVQKPIQNAIGVDFGSSCFLPKLGLTSQFTWFCAFLIKSRFCFEANLQQDKLQYFWPKKGTTMSPWQAVLWFRV